MTTSALVGSEAAPRATRPPTQLSRQGRSSAASGRKLVFVMQSARDRCSNDLMTGQKPMPTRFDWRGVQPRMGSATVVVDRPRHQDFSQVSFAQRNRPPTSSRPPPPEEAEALTLPADQRPGPYDGQRSRQLNQPVLTRSLPWTRDAPRSLLRGGPGFMAKLQSPPPFPEKEKVSAKLRELCRLVPISGGRSRRKTPVCTLKPILADVNRDRRDSLAERRGFEPPERFHAHLRSHIANPTALPRRQPSPVAGLANRLGGEL
jgi:hypothetical protein